MGLRSRSPTLRNFFGSGGGGGSSTTGTTVNGSNSSGNAAAAASTSIGNNPKFPPTSTTTTNSRASSPFNWWRGKSSSSTAAATGTQNSTEEKRQEEKKESENKDAPATLRRPGMRDQSPGASPHRLGSAAAHAAAAHPSSSSSVEQQPPHIPPQNHNPNHPNSYQPPKQIFHPSSPVRQQLPPVSSSSRPSTPVSYGMNHHHPNNTNNISSNRPPSRCSSPYSARPGLQEDGESDSLSILNRSPGRAFEAVPTSAIPPAQQQQQQQQTISNMQGMSSQQPQQHRRMYSGGGNIDPDNISQPVPPRTHSRSPMRRPSPIDSDDVGNRQPVIPRAFSASPRGRNNATTLPHAATANHNQNNNGSSSSSSNSEHIKMPDLSMPSFGSPNTATNGLGGGHRGSASTMFTPTPRVVPPSWPTSNDDDDGAQHSAEGVEVMASFPDGTNPQTAAHFGLQPRPPGAAAEAFNVNALQFQMGSMGINHSRFPYRGSMGGGGSNHRRGASTKTDPPMVPRTPSIPRHLVGSPMEIDEPSPPSMYSATNNTSLPQMASPSQPNVQFQVGAVEPKPRRVSRVLPPARSSMTEEIPRPTVTTFASPDYGTPTKHDPSAAAASTNPSQDSSYRVEFIASKREEAKVSHMSGDYRSSITSYTEAIKMYGEAAALLTSDTLAVLLSNRAAGLLMIGAYDAAVSDCELALRKVTPPRVNEQFSNDSGLLLKIKLLTRLARAHLKLGDYNAASISFNDAIRTANTASQFSKKNHSDEIYQQNQQTLNQMITEATLGHADAKRLRDACAHISNRSVSNLKFPSERIKYAESLGHVNLALSIASGSVSLIENKINILVFMKRWREVAGFCERLAAFNVGLDNAFRDDLALKHPFPGAAPAQALKGDFFGGLRDEDASTRELKLSSRAAAEAILRIPYSLVPMYLRAMRLEERYPAAEAALRSLEDLIRRGAGVKAPTQYLQTKFNWLPKERKKLERTKEGREHGDELFRLQDFEKAATKYGECLLIDGDGCSDPVDGLNAGGRLHAVLHCNRAACLMALRRFHAAVDECSNALKIHSRYMKAILRRARCYARLSRAEEAISEYKRWLDLVEEAKKTDYSPSSPCLFDGPRDVKDAEVSLTRKELEELYKAKHRADATRKEEADRARDQERVRSREGFSNSWHSSTRSNAHDRRDQWYNDQSGSRRWDSFSNRGPRSSSNPRPDGNGTERDNHRSNSQGRTRAESLVSPRSNTADHYSVLNLTPNATTEEIKKSFRKLALKYHPDKNTDDGASDNFRRVKLAHEVLTDPIKRRQYDSERQLGVGRHF